MSKFTRKNLLGLNGNFLLLEKFLVKVAKMVENKFNIHVGEHYSIFRRLFKCIFSTKLCKIKFPSGKVSLVVGLLFTLSSCIPRTVGSYRYTLDSCSDLVPKQTQVPAEHIESWQPQQSGQNQNSPGWRRSLDGGGSGSLMRKVNKRETYLRDESPVRITAPGRRYRRNTEVYVNIEAGTYYDAMMVQGRAVSQNGEFVNGGVGLLGRFDPSRVDRRNFSYLECFREPYGTVVDKGFTRMGNVTLIWTAPDADKGRIRFLAGITKGNRYWVIVSNILEFNPYPISTVQCGGTDACFRICPLDSISGLCGASDALLMYAYNTEILGKREIEFTLGGRLNSALTSYIAVVYAEDNDQLYQADVTLCYVDHGKARVEHYLMEYVGAELLKHSEEITLDDYDFDGTMLWCKYRRPISYNHNSVIHPWKTFFTLLYRGELSLLGYPKFVTPSRSNMYSSDQRYNLTTPINKIYSGSSRLYDSFIGFPIVLLIISKVF